MRALLKYLPAPRYSIAVALILAVMAGLMIGAMRQESATVDETTYIGSGYAYLKTGSFRLSEPHPILSQLIGAFPISFFSVHESPTAKALLEARAFIPYTRRWTGGIVMRQDVFPQGPNFYEWALPEQQLFGQLLVYDPANDADAILFACRLPQVALTLAAGLFIFWWARKLGGDLAGLLGLMLWAFNPVALAYGHQVLTDPVITLMFGLDVWLFCRFLKEPTRKHAIIMGAAMGLSLVLKFTSLMLLPTAAILTVVYWWKVRPDAAWRRGLVRGLLPMALAVWGVVMIVYFPHWSPAPAPDPALAAKLGVPGWFLTLRPILIPGELFKEITLYVGMAHAAYDSYLMGQWSTTGWWYYFPLATALKTPVALWGLTLAGIGLFLWNVRDLEFDQLAPWLGIPAYLGFAMTSNINIGVRHMMPVFLLLAIGVAVQLAQLQRHWRFFVGMLCAWLVAAALVAYPYYIHYFTEVVGGARNGYQYLTDSNFDWGQDAKRLKRYVEKQGIQHIYLNYYGTQAAIEYHKIPNTRVSAEQAKQIREGYLVVSASSLVSPEWTWLRESREPIDRIAYTLFVYRLP